ncbi:lipopolysaccharide biosynthesis protein [Lacrimispora indolis]|uniref:lipopolysaccharide biosynthesis protein n=1 Tax=Lacrimispora indolis TaxID=69825 RepID=UPI00045E9948|nr:oligosaccharide flippase family protein [Lacrimispora indolis]
MDFNKLKLAGILMGNNSGSKVLKASVVYILVSLVNKGIGIITVPVFTRLLTTEEMGTVTTWISWLTVLTPITSLSLVSGSIYIAMNEYSDRREAYQSSVLTLTSIISSMCLVIYVLFHSYLNQLFMLPTTLMIFMFIYLFFSPALDMWMLRQRYEYNTKKMALVTLASNLSASIVAVVLVLILQDEPYDLGNIRIFATYTITGIFALFCYFKIFRTGKVMFNKEFWNFGIKLSAPLMVHTLAKNILDVSDRSMISLYCGKGDVGIYGTIYSISTLSLIVWNSINSAFVPYLYEKLEHGGEEDTRDITKLTYIMIFLYAIVCIGLTAVAPELVRILTTEEYYEAIYIIPPLSAGIFLTCVYNIFSNVVLFHKKSVGIMCSTVVAAAINISLNAVFIPMYGYIAASYTTLAAFVVLAISQGIVMVHIHDKKLYDMKMIAFISTIVVMLCVAFNVLYRSTLIRYLVILVLAIVIFASKKSIVRVLSKLKGN